MTYFSSFFTLWRIFDVLMHFLMLWHTFLTSWHSYVMTYFLTSWHTFWCHCILLDIMTYFTYILTSWCTFWRHDVLLDIMTYFCFMLWRTFWRHDVLVTLRALAHMLWRHDVLSILFDVIAYFVMSMSMKITKSSITPERKEHHSNARLVLRY